MRNLNKYITDIYDIYESLLADMDDVLYSGDKHMDEELLKSWANDDNVKIVKTKTGYKLKGDFNIKNIVETKYNGPKIKLVQGNLAISNTNLTSLENIFDIDCEIKGTFTIDNNKNLISLKGCPMQVNTLVISNNKSLKDLSLAPTVLINAYISKNGKKFDKESLSKTLQVYKNIFCSIEDESNIIEESLLLEAFKAPQLKILADAINKWRPSKVEHVRGNQYKFDFQSILNIEWDKIEPSQISEYEVSDPDCIKLARKYISDRNGLQGIMVPMTASGEVLGIVKQKGFIRLLDRKEYMSYPELNKWTAFDQWNTTDIIDIIKRFADTVLFIDLTKVDLTTAWKKHKERMDRRVDAIAYHRELKKERDNNEVTAKDVRYYQNIADENRKRYKTLVTQIKAKRAILSNNFINIKAKLDDVFKRYTEILLKIQKDPLKYDTWDVRWLNEKFNYTAQGKHGYISQHGLLPAINMYMTYLLESSHGESHKDDIQKKLKEFENILINKIDAVDKKLTELESK